MLAEAAIPVPSRRVLVVDDDAAVRNSLKFSLEIEGFTVRDYSSANELMRESEIADAGCLVIDYHLPELNGLEMLYRLRERRVAHRHSDHQPSQPFGAPARGRSRRANRREAAAGQCADGSHPQRLRVLIIGAPTPSRCPLHQRYCDEVSARLSAVARRAD